MCTALSTRFDISNKMEGLRERIAKLAAERGKTQLEVERAAGVAHSTYDGMWERGTVTLDRIERIARFLDVDLVYLLTGRLTASVVAEPAAPYEVKPKYLEDRVAQLETEVRKLKEQLRPR